MRIMNHNKRWPFLILVFVQGLHSIEEYIGELWVVFPPARILCGLISDDLVTGFLIINIGLFIFGLWCWLFPIRKNYSYARFLIWFWIGLELINGSGHLIWTFTQKEYTPGLLTAPLLFILAIYVLRKQRHFEKVAM